MAVRAATVSTPPRKPQRSPQRALAIERRRRLVSSGPFEPTGRAPRDMLALAIGFSAHPSKQGPSQRAGGPAPNDAPITIDRTVAQSLRSLRSHHLRTARATLG